MDSFDQIHDNINDKYDFNDFMAIYHYFLFKIIDIKNIKKYYYYVYNKKM